MKLYLTLQKTFQENAIEMPLENGPRFVEAPVH